MRILQVRLPASEASMAREALGHFMTAQNLDFVGSPPPPAAAALPENACAAWSRQSLGYDACLPEGLAACPIRGGRACRVNGRAAACYLLDSGRGLYVFERPFRDGQSVAGKPMAVAAGFQARAWNEAGRGYVIVEPVAR